VQFLIILAFGMVMLTDQFASPVIIAPGFSGAVAVITAILALILIWIRLARKKIFLRLESGRLPLGSVQSTCIQAQHGLRILAIVGQGLLLFGTNWPSLVRSVIGKHTLGLDDLIILLPFILWLVAGYFFFYPADRAIRESMLGHMLDLSEPVHPIWTRWQYVDFQIRFQILLIGLPLMIIICAKDILDAYEPTLIAFCRPIFAFFNLRVFAANTPELILAACAGVIFLLSPFMIRLVWKTQSLPQGQLRTTLQRLAQNANLNYRDILLWPTYGVIVNAAVIGFLGPMRYILLSDGLIESLTDGQIEGVFGHEVGHVKLHHLTLLLLFAIVSMGLVGLAGWQIQISFHLSEQLTQMIVLGAIIAVWFIAFGYVSRKFEAQADLFGAQLLSREFDRGNGCGYPNCLRHQTSPEPTINTRKVCIAGSELFSSALDRTASLNAVPRSANSWRHGSIQQRCSFVIRCAEDFSTLVNFQASIWWIKISLLAGLAVCIVWGLSIVARFI